MLPHLSQGHHDYYVGTVHDGWMGWLGLGGVQRVGIIILFIFCSAFVVLLIGIS